MFYFPFTLMELAARLIGTGQSPLRDGSYILDMLIPLEPVEARERYARLYPGVEPPDVAADGNEQHPGHLFTCRHWDEETRLCGAYEQRPMMCRTFPYGTECSIYGCGYGLPLTEAKAYQRLSEWSWRGWRWRRGAYHAPADFIAGATYEPGEDWRWDSVKRTLAPLEPDRWDPRKRAYREA